MLHILLLILKITGILLAAVAGLLLLILLAVLFVPVRYRIKADGRLGEEEPLRAEARIYWLLHIVNVAFFYPGAAYLKIRVFCFPIFDSSRTAQTADKPNRKAEKKRKGQKKAADREETADREAEAGDKTKEDVPGETRLQGKTDREAQFSEKEEAGADRKETKEAGADRKEPEEETGIRKFGAAVIRILKQIPAAFKNIEYTIRKICDKIRKIMEDIRYYTEVLQSEVFRAALDVSKKQLHRIFRTLRPGKCTVNLTVGTGDPAGTGQVLAVYGMMYPFIGNNVFIQADFEKKIIEGDLYIKGKITIFRLLLAAFRLYTDKNIRKLLKLLKREDA